MYVLDFAADLLSGRVGIANQRTNLRIAIGFESSKQGWAAAAGGAYEEHYTTALSCRRGLACGRLVTHLQVRNAVHATFPARDCRARTGQFHLVLAGAHGDPVAEHDPDGVATPGSARVNELELETLALAYLFRKRSDDPGAICVEDAILDRRHIHAATEYLFKCCAIGGLHRGCEALHGRSRVRLR